MKEYEVVKVVEEERFIIVIEQPVEDIDKKKFYEQIARTIVERIN